MKKTIYEAPCTEVVKVRIENNFLATGDPDVHLPDIGNGGDDVQQGPIYW